MAIVRALDPVALRADFEIFEREFRGRRLAYLDSAATSLKPRVVAEAMAGYLNRYSANVHRGIYEIGEEATAAYEAARSKIAALHRRRTPREIVMVRNATEAINLVAYAWGRKNIGRADTIVHDRDGAPLQPRPVADADPGEGRRSRVRALRRARAD